MLRVLPPQQKYRKRVLEYSYLEENRVDRKIHRMSLLECRSKASLRQRIQDSSRRFVPRRREACRGSPEKRQKGTETHPRACISESKAQKVPPRNRSIQHTQGN